MIYLLKKKNNNQIVYFSKDNQYTYDKEMYEQVEYDLDYDEFLQKCDGRAADTNFMHDEQGIKDMREYLHGQQDT
jgi:hypothetical protein